MNNLTLIRIQKEYKQLQDDPSLLPNAFVSPNPDNLLEWHFVIYGLDEQYKGGVYHGIINLPENYPKSPPGIKVLTPSGRFIPNASLCLSISNFHPESWNRGWKVYQVLLGLISVMNVDDENGVGMIYETKKVRQRYARDSMEFNMQKDIFKTLFKVSTLCFYL
jgi:ubiquitin-conjugating enzyme E2 J2